MLRNELEVEFGRAVACLDFVVGALTRSKDGLEPKEVNGLVYVLSDILAVFKEVTVIAVATGEEL